MYDRSFRSWVVALFLITGLTLSATPVSAQPRIEFASEIHDYGDVNQGETVEYTFSFVNRGNEELVIGKVSTS